MLATLAVSPLPLPQLASVPQCAPLHVVRPSLLRMAVIEVDDARMARVSKLEEIIEEFDAVTDDPKVFSELMDEWSGLKKAELKTGSSEWTKVVVEAEQRSEAFKWASQQQAAQRGSAFVRDREWAERRAAEGLTPGSSEWAAAVGKASMDSALAYQAAEAQMLATREAANKKRAALLGVLLADESSEPEPLAISLATDAALDALFNSGYDEGSGSSLSADEMKRMQGVITSTSAALRRNGKDVALLLRRAAILVALGEPARARIDYERVLELDPTNPDAKKCKQQRPPAYLLEHHTLPGHTSPTPTATAFHALSPL